MANRAGLTVIVGGGISGLTAAWSLQQAGRECAVLEASARLGGIITTGHEEGFVYEGGPDSFLAVKAAGVELCRELGLEDRLIGTEAAPGGARVLFRGRLEPIPTGWQTLRPARLGPVLRSRLFSPVTKAAMALHWMSTPAEPREDETARAYLERCWGRGAGAEIAARIVEPLLAGVYGGRSDQLSAANLRPAMPRPAGGAIFLSLRGGMGELVSALAQRLGARARTGCGVLGLDRNGGGYRLELPRGETLEASAVIVASPAWRAAALLRGLDAAVAEPLAEIPCASSVNINLAYRRAPALPPGHGFLGGEGAIRACTFAHQKFAGRAPAGGALLRVFYGEEAAGMDEAELTARARADLQTGLGIAAEPAWARVQRAWRALPQYTVGHGARLLRLEAALARHPRLALAGNELGGVGVPDCIASGRKAAARVLVALG